ncbi:unnamed protein product [Trifolium pratense]|uniref:Uncharacterized protein n=1 Tax=Trifolium pratense TaxID=57577 RepID=A0ACB0IAG1_TRIPR|nr:unnamed protein product [Trifolium pratense]
MDFVFSESEHGRVFYNKFGMDYHIPVFGDIVKEPLLCISFILLLRGPNCKGISSKVMEAFDNRLLSKIKGTGLFKAGDSLNIWNEVDLIQVDFCKISFCFTLILAWDFIER